MKWCVAGAGAIGSLIGARLLATGEDVALLARGAHLAAMRRDGLTLLSPSGDERLRPFASDDANAIGPVDVVLLALKAHQIAAALTSIRALLHDDTAIVALQNGIPWWYTEGHPLLAGRALDSVDPGGRIATALGTPRAIAGVLYMSASLAAPGTVRHTHGNRIVIGEPSGQPSQRIERIAAALRHAGFDAPVSPAVRCDVWAKLLGNLNFNPISALTRSTMAEMFADDAIVALIRETMMEGMAVAQALGDAPQITVEERLAASPRNETRTSMLQDLEAGRPFEIDAIVGAVVELANIAGVQTPAMSVVFALAALLDRSARGVTS